VVNKLSQISRAVFERRPRSGNEKQVSKGRLWVTIRRRGFGTFLSSTGWRVGEEKENWRRKATLKSSEKLKGKMSHGKKHSIHPHTKTTGAFNWDHQELRGSLGKKSWVRGEDSDTPKLY